MVDGEKILKIKSISEAKKYAIHGISSYIRPQIWDLILQSQFSDNLKEHVSFIVYQHELSLMV